MKTPTPAEAQAALRHRAERHRLVAESLPPTASPEVQRLVQELQVHQIELEMQNEELLRAQAEAETSRLQYVDLYDFAPVGYCTLAADGTLTQLNLRTAQLLGQERRQLQGRRLALFVAPPDRDRLAGFVARLWAQPGQRQSCELAMRRADDAPFFGQLEGVALPEGPDEARPPTSCRLVLLDVTERRRAQDELRAKNRLLDNILQNMPVVLARIGPDGRYREQAGLGLRRLDLADNERVGQPAATSPEAAATLAQLLAGRPLSTLLTLAHAGQPVVLQCAGFFDAERQEAVVFALDVTEPELLKQQAQQQQQQVLAAVFAAQEEERRRIAEGLHNGLGQLLYGTRLHLDALPPSEAVRAAQALVNEAIAATRSISFELTPSILEDFGLVVALRELVSRIPGPLAVDLNLHGLDRPLPPLLATAAYRMVQELLNNVMKHAQAREVFVQVSQEDGQLHLSVEDDGVGFAPPEAGAPAAPSGIGLAGIRTRVGLLGGTFTVQSRPGRGTGFFLQLPVPAAAG